MNDNFHLFEMKNNSICLDGKKINGIRAYKLEQKEGDSLAELSLEMDVRIFDDRYPSHIKPRGRKECMKLKHGKKDSLIKRLRQF